MAHVGCALYRDCQTLIVILMIFYFVFICVLNYALWLSNSTDVIKKDFTHETSPLYEELVIVILSLLILN